MTQKINLIYILVKNRLYKQQIIMLSNYKLINKVILPTIFSIRNFKMKKQNVQGFDSKGSKYRSIQEMWKIQLQNAEQKLPVFDKVGGRQKWYQGGNQYWTNTEASYNGVLGGYGNLSDPDIKFSLNFMIQLFKLNSNIKRQTVLDCGAGIGRITKQLLCRIYKIVDLTDQCEKYIITAKKELQKIKNIRNFYVKGLQEFKFEQKYDCVWIQWVLGYLPDKQAIQFFERAKSSLNQNGIIIVKQNVCKNGFIVDKDDFSVTRSQILFKKLFKQSKLKIIKQQYQTGWPEDLFDVKMFALQIQQ